MNYTTRNGKAVDAASLRGQLNRYTCQSCGGSIVTVDRDEGVTPFALPCLATWKRICEGPMYSSFYRGVTGKPTYEWRKPTPEEYAVMSPGMREQIDKGGLNIYPVQP